MPWDYKTNKPDSVKFLHPKIQRKAIAIANAIVREGGDEGLAISTGIKRAKGLVKLAIILPIGGAFLGAHFGGKIGKKENRKRNANIGAIIGGAAGIGANIGLFKMLQKQKFGQYRHSGYYQAPRPPKPQQTDIPSFFKQHGHNHSNIKTKLQAKKIYRDAARKTHPDLGGDVEKLKKLNIDWEGVENSSWFNKLAAFHNTKFYRSLVKAFKKNDDKFLNKKYNNIIDIIKIKKENEK